MDKYDSIYAIMDMDDEKLRDLLDDGVWEDAIVRWRDDGDLSREDYELIRDIDLLDEYEFFWDEEVDRVGYECPSIPKDWKTESYSDRIDSWAQVSRINMALNELGNTVREIVEEEILD